MSYQTDVDPSIVDTSKFAPHSTGLPANKRRALIVRANTGGFDDEGNDDPNEDSDYVDNVPEGASD